MQRRDLTVSDFSTPLQVLKEELVDHQVRPKLWLELVPPVRLRRLAGGNHAASQPELRDTIFHKKFNFSSSNFLPRAQRFLLDYSLGGASFYCCAFFTVTTQGKKLAGTRETANLPRSCKFYLTPPTAPFIALQ